MSVPSEIPAPHFFVAAQQDSRSRLKRLVGHLVPEYVLKSKERYQIYGREVPFCGISRYLTLEIFTTEKNVGEIIDLFQLSRGVELLSKSIDFFERVQQIPQNLLRQISLFDLQTASFRGALEYNRLRWIFMSDVDFLMYPLEGLRLCTIDEMCVIFERLKWDRLEAFQGTPTLGALPSLEGDALAGVIHHIPNCMLLDEQVLGLDFAGLDLPIGTLDRIFDFSYNGVRRFRALSGENLQAVLSKVSLDRLVNTTVEQMKNLDFARLNSLQIKRILQIRENEKWAVLSEQQQKAILDKRVL